MLQISSVTKYFILRLSDKIRLVCCESSFMIWYRMMKIETLRALDKLDRDE